MRSLVLSIIILVLSTNLHAQPVTGDWYGALEVQGHKLHLVFHVKKDDNGFSSTMDSPDQGAAGIPTDATTYQNGELTIEKRAMSIVYTAAFDSVTMKLDGNFQQGSFKLPLLLTRTKEEPKKAEPRPQDPTDFPYYQEEVTIKNGKDSVTLAGTLTLPKDRKAEKIVILITGSGPQNRNEEIKQFNHRPFLVWSDWLTRHGIGVLRYDDRGIGASTGIFSKATSADFADDVSAAIDFVASRDDLKGVKIGLMGHSEGGMIAPMVAARDKRVKFIVLLAGPGAPIDELMTKQIENSQEGMPEELAKFNVQTSKMIYAFLKQHKDEPSDKIEPELRKMLTEQFKKYPNSEDKNGVVDAMVNEQIKIDLGVWFRYFVPYIPAENLEKVKCPVLAVNGTLDKQVDAEQNLTAIEAALKKGRNKHYEIVRLPGLNHLMQKATTGNPDEYEKIEETVDPLALNTVTDWINK